MKVLKANQYEHGWWFGRSAAENAEGLFPKNYVRKLNAEDMPPPPPPRPLPNPEDDHRGNSRPLSMRAPRKKEDQSFVFESLEAFDSLMESGERSPNHSHLCCCYFV